MTERATGLPTNQKQVLLRSRPQGIPQPENFELVDGPVRTPREGELLIRNEYLSIDPAMRGWVSSESNYAEPVPLDAVMKSFAVGTVVGSRDDRYPSGSRVMGLFGWQGYATVPADAVISTVGHPDLSPSLSLGVLGMPGATAWMGVRLVLEPQAGETLVVSTGAGSVGSAAGQLAKVSGARTVAITGGAEKVRICLEEFGYDAAVDYRSPSFAEDLAAAVPNGIDAYFDNTSGNVSDTVLQHINIGARIAISGTAAIASWAPWPEGPRVERHLLTCRARMQGFLFFDHLDRLDEALDEIAGLIRDGRLRYREDASDGLETAPGSIAELYRGENLGKRVIRLP